MIEFICDKCWRQHLVNDNLRGKRGKCSCGNIVIIPAPPAKEIVVREVAKEHHTPEVMPEAVPVVEEELYIKDTSGVEEFFATHRIYCQKCKRTHSDDVCPWCGTDLSRRGSHVCMYCNTSYRMGRKNCPICKVNNNLIKATGAKTPKTSLKYWQAAYDEARSNGYHFSIAEHLFHARYLIEAGRGDEACSILNQFVGYCGQHLASTKGSLKDKKEYFSFLSAIENTFADKVMADERQYRERHGQQNPGLAVAYAVHVILSSLYNRTVSRIDAQLWPEAYGSLSTDSQRLREVHVARMKRVLINIKKNKRGRPEELCEVIDKHLANIPRIDMPALEQDVATVLTQWQ